MSGGYGNNDLLEKFKTNKLISLIIKLLYPPMPTLNTMRSKDLNLIKNKLFKSSSKVLNIGSGLSNGVGHRLWKDLDYKDFNLINLDIIPGENIDVVADAHNLPFKEKEFDSIIIQSTLEHVKNPIQVISESFRVLKKEGYIYIEVPFLQGIHGDPDDYQRYTLSGLKELLHEFDIITRGVSVGPMCTVVWYLRDLFSSIFKNKFLYYFTRFLAGWFFSPIRYIDYIIINRPAYYRLASEYFILGKKK